MVNIKVFNPAGRLVAIVGEGIMRNVGIPAVDKWDGRDINGKWARNGRYIIQIEIEDTGGKKQYLYTAALIK